MESSFAISSHASRPYRAVREDVPADRGDLP